MSGARGSSPASYCVVGQYVDHPSEGMQVVTRAVADGLRGLGRDVRIVDPKELPRRLPGLLARPPGAFVFTHGPGTGVAAASRLLRLVGRSRIVWVMTRPDLGHAPAWLRGRTAHAVIGNRFPAEVGAVATDARYVHQFIGIDPRRLGAPGAAPEPAWRRDLPPGRPVALHVGHIRRNRGLELLAAAKRRLGERLEVVVLGSPTFAPDADVLQEVEAAGVRVVREYVADIAAQYRAADLYLFPVASAAGGAIDLPLSVLEALACGAPVLSTPFGSLPAALRGVEGVWLAEPEAFCETLETLVGSGAYRTVEARLPEHLSVERLVAAVVDSVEGSSVHA